MDGPTMKLIRKAREAMALQQPAPIAVLTRDEWPQFRDEIESVSMGHLAIPDFDSYIDGSAKFYGMAVYRAL